MGLELWQSADRKVYSKAERARDHRVLTCQLHAGFLLGGTFRGDSGPSLHIQCSAELIVNNQAALSIQVHFGHSAPSDIQHCMVSMQEQHAPATFAEDCSCF